jgi:hypothetical protein
MLKGAAALAAAVCQEFGWVVRVASVPQKDILEPFRKDCRLFPILK